MSSAEQNLQNLENTLREAANTATQIADQIAKAVAAMYEQEQTTAQPAPLIEMPETTSFIGANFNPNIIQLVSNEKFTWDMSAQNVTDLKDYCFVEVITKSSTNIGFTFISSSLGRVVLTQYFDQAIHDMMEVGGIYVCHNIRKGKKLHWDKTICLTDLGLTKEQCISKAKMLARIFAEQR